MDNITTKMFEFLEAGEPTEQVLYLQGQFGTGKSHILIKFKQELINSPSSVVLFDYNHNPQIKYLHEFIYNLSMSCFAPAMGDPKETFDNRNFFLNLLNQSYSINKTLFNLIKKANHLKNVPAYLAMRDSAFNISEIEQEYELKRDDIRLLFEPEVIAAESFVVDLLNKLSIGVDGEALPSTIVKKKVLIVIDNYDSAAGSINNWLFNYFLITLNEKTFENYTFYDIKSFPNDAVAADYVDCRIILAGRELPKPYPETLKFIHLQTNQLTKQEIVAFFKESNIDIEANYDFIYQITQGIPLIIKLLIESIIIGNGEIEDLSKIEQVAGLDAMKYLSGEEQDMLRAASYLSEFDQEALSFMPLIKDKSAFAYEFFKNSTNLAVKTESGKYSIRSNYKGLIRNEVAAESQKTAKTLETIAGLYNSFTKFIKNFEPEERDIIKHLAYFNNFDKFFAIQEYFGDKAATARKTIEKYPVIFQENKFTVKMNDDISGVILSLEESASTLSYEEAKNKIKQIWDKRLAELNAELTRIDKELSDIKTNLETLEHEDNTSFQEQKKYEAESAAAYYEHDELSAILKRYKIDSNISLWAVPQIISFVLIYLKFFSVIEFEGAISGAVDLLIAVFISFGAFRAYKFFKAKSSGLDYSKEKSKCDLLEETARNSEAKSKEVKVRRDMLAVSLLQAKDLKNKLEKDLDIVRTKLKETFVREEK